MTLDRLSKHAVVKLAQLEEATASELREALGLEQNQSIHYRMDKKLIPEGLVLEKPERREQPGSRKAARVYQITSKGAEWAKNHGHEITLSDLDEAEQEIQRLSAEIRNLSDDVRSLKEWRQEQAGHTGGVTTRLSALSDRLDDAEALIQKHDGRDYSGIWDRLHDLDDRADRLDENLPEEPATEDDVRRVKENLHDRAEDIDSRMDDITTTQSELTEWSNSMDKRVRQLEEQANQSLLQRLWPF